MTFGHEGEHGLARSLSGGNQQKLIIGREVDRDPDLLIAALPTTRFGCWSDRIHP